MLKKKDIEMFDQIEFLGVVDNKFRVLIKKGFSGNANDTLRLMGIVNEKTNNEYPIIDVVHTDINLFDYTIKKDKPISVKLAEKYFNNINANYGNNLTEELENFIIQAFISGYNSKSNENL